MNNLKFDMENAVWDATKESLWEFILDHMRPSVKDSIIRTVYLLVDNPIIKFTRDNKP